MNLFLAFLFLLMTVLPARATVIDSSPPHETLEYLAMGISGMTAVANVMTMLDRKPINGLAAAGILIGSTTVALTTLNDIEHPVGLTAIGSIAAVAGIAALRYRHVLDDASRVSLQHARLEPSWSSGAPGLAFVVDF